MKYSKLILIGICCFFSTILTSQNCTPESKVSLSSNKLTINSLEKLIEQNRPSYSDIEINSIIREISKCNDEVDIQLRKIENGISSYSLSAQELHRYKDVSSIRERIQTLKKSLKESKNELKRNLSQIAQTGIYAVLLENIDTYEDKNSLVKKAQQALYPFAIKDLNGVNINRLTSVTNYQSTKDIIVSLSSGKVSDKKRFMDKQNFLKKYFLYVVQSSVVPLEDNNLKGTSTNLSDNTLIVKISNDNSYEHKLLQKGVVSSDIQEVRDLVSRYISITEEENNIARLKQKRIIEKGEEEVQKIETDINEIQNSLIIRSSKIEDICKKYNIKFRANNLNKSAQEAFSFLKTQIKEGNKEWYKYKQQELIYKETVTTIEGSASRSIAEESIKLATTINEQFNKISKTSERIIIDDYEINSYEGIKKTEIYREIEKIWIYPIPQNGNTYRVLVVAKFQITQNAKPIPSELTRRDKKYIKKSSEAYSYYKKGYDRYIQSKYKTAQVFLEEAIKQEAIPEAYYLLGRYYENDARQEIDFIKAKKYYEKAIQLGDLKAYYGLGALYLSGNGVKKNERKANKNFSKAIPAMQFAAKEGNSLWQTNLGFCYYNGHGVEKDLTKAFHLVEKAASKGYSRAYYFLGLCYNNGEGVIKNVDKAIKNYKQSASMGYSNAQVILARFYYHGNGVEQNYTQAKYWFEKAAVQYNSDGQTGLGVCYHMGQGVKKDKKQAKYWYRLAAKQGNETAKGNLIKLKKR